MNVQNIQNKKKLKVLVEKAIFLPLADV
jgi:hypothetical protein